MSRKRSNSIFGHNGNCIPGRRRGVKSKKVKNKLLPQNMGWSWSEMSWIGRGVETVPGGPADRKTWYKPFKAKPINRREKRGQGKPR